MIKYSTKGSEPGAPLFYTGEIFAAINRGDISDVERLLNIFQTDTEKYNINSTNNEGDTPLLYAARKNKDAIVNLILEYMKTIGAKTNARSKDGKTYTEIQDAHRTPAGFRPDGRPDIFRLNIERALREAAQQDDMEVEGGGERYTIYNNKKYKICTGKRGGKYICIGKEKRKVYI